MMNIQSPDSSFSTPVPEAHRTSREAALKLHDHLRRAVLVERRAMREIALGFAAMERGRLHRELGYASMAEYGDQLFGYSSSKTRQLGLLGRRLSQLPELDQAMREGAIGWTKARTICQVADADTIGAWIQRAKETTSRELEDQVYRARPGQPPPGDEIDLPRYMWIRARLDPYHFEQFMKAVSMVRSDLGDYDISVSQALLWLAEQYIHREGSGQEACLAHVCTHEEPGQEDALHDPSTASRADRGENAWFESYRVIEHRCPECRKAWMDTRAGPMEMLPHTRELVECDAEVVAGDRSGGTPGHITRTVPPATRRAVIIRDHGRCQVPGCRHRKYLDIHHITPRSCGGDHSMDNLVTLCQAHHDMVHSVAVSLKRSGNGDIRCDRGLGEPLALVVSIFGEWGELGHESLAEFEQEPGSWQLISGYWGSLDPPPGCPPDQLAEAPVRLQDRYPRGRQEIRIGDEAQMAPSWMASNVSM